MALKTDSHQMEWELHICQLSHQIGCSGDCHHQRLLWQWLPITIVWTPPQQ